MPRCTILYKYGGAYMDWDVTWSSPIPDSLRRYQMVGGMDWPVYHEYPEAFNLGVAMAKPGAPFLKHFLESFRCGIMTSAMMMRVIYNESWMLRKKRMTWPIRCPQPLLVITKYQEDGLGILLIKYGKSW